MSALFIWGSGFVRRFRNPPVGYRHGRRAQVIGRFPLVHWLYYWLTAHLTPRLLLLGFVGVAPTAIMMLIGFNSRFFLMGFAVLAWMAACVAVGYFQCPRVSVEAQMPLRVECGSTFETRYRVSNVGRRTARSLSVDTLIYSGVTHLRLRSAALGTLAAGESETVTGGGWAWVRGVFALPALRWDSDYPCCFWRWGRTDYAERTLFVYPRYARLESLDLPLGHRNRNELSSASQLSREAFEFHGCREFRDGDALRHVHPRSSARLGVPVVKEFQTEGRSRTAVLVDTRGRMMFGGVREHLLKDDPVEAALSLTASIVDALSVTDRVLELLVAGPEVYRFVSSGRVGYLEEVLDILAGIEPCKEDPLDRLEPLLFEEIRLIQSVCLILTGWDARREALIREIGAWEIGLKAVLVTARGKRPEGLLPQVACLSARDILRGEVCSV